jgi:hypothetical protein
MLLTYPASAQLAPLIGVRELKRIYDLYPTKNFFHVGRTSRQLGVRTDDRPMTLAPTSRETPVMRRSAFVPPSPFLV